MTTRLHLGCGTIYLQNFINIDNIGYLNKNINLEANKATVDNYYRYNLKYAMKTAKERKVIVDLKDDICTLKNLKKSGIKEDMVKEIICVQVLEHIEENKILPTLKLWYEMLNKKGSILLSVLDTVGVIEHTYMDSILDRDNLNWCFRLLYGSEKNKHVSWFDNIKLKDLLSNAGFKNIKNSIKIQHDYPALVIRAYK